MNGDKSPFSQLNFNENKKLVGSVSLTFMFDAGKILSRDGGGGGVELEAASYFQVTVLTPVHHHHHHQDIDCPWLQLSFRFTHPSSSYTEQSIIILEHVNIPDSYAASFGQTVKIPSKLKYPFYLYFKSMDRGQALRVDRNGYYCVSFFSSFP